MLYVLEPRGSLPMSEYEIVFVECPDCGWDDSIFVKQSETNTLCPDCACSINIKEVSADE